VPENIKEKKSYKYNIQPFRKKIKKIVNPEVLAYFHRESKRGERERKSKRKKK
jgi:hypothetical protein